MKHTRLPLIALLSLPLLAHAESHYNQISFGVESTKTVANDELTATLTKTADHTNAKTLANTLNTTANQALAIAKKYPNVQATTGRQHTYPRYDNKGKMNGFTGSLSINVNSQNFAEASEFIAELQAFMNLSTLNFGVSDTTKKAVEQELKQQVAKRFQDEALTLSHAFGANNYKIVKVNFHNSNNHYPIMPAPMAMMAKADSAIAPQTFEAGDSQVSYGADGVIELVK